MHVDDDDSKGWMQTSRSYDNLADIQVDKKPTKKKGFFKRLLTLRKGVTMPSTSRKKTKDKSRDSVISTTSSEVARENSLTSSVSMPDITCEFTACGGELQETDWALHSVRGYLCCLFTIIV